MDGERTPQPDWSPGRAQLGALRRGHWSTCPVRLSAMAGAGLFGPLADYTPGPRAGQTHPAKTPDGDPKKKGGLAAALFRDPE